MSEATLLALFGIDHHRAPTEIRERAHLDDAAAVALMNALAQTPGFVSVIPVSTCNRTEIYLEVRPGHDPAEILRRALGAIGAEADLFFSEYAQRRDGPDAIGHLYRVAAGLESMMLGEPQIAGQLKDAYRLARKHQEPGPGLLRAFQGSFRAGKRVRTETRISQGAVSVAFAAVELARKFFAHLSDHTAVLVGAGETGALAARHFLQHEIGRLIVVNRSPERAEKLASALNAELRAGLLKDAKMRPVPVPGRSDGADRVSVLPWSQLQQAMAEADVILSTTGSLEPVILPEMVAQAVQARRGDPLFLLDIAVPRDIHPDAAKIDGAFAFGLDDLDEMIQNNLEARRRQLPHAEKIIAEELAEFQRWLAEVDLRPTVAEFRAYLEDLKDKQVGFVRKKKSAELAAEVDRNLQHFIKKVLGRSVSTLKRAETPEERERDLDTLKRIFSDDQ